MVECNSVEDNLNNQYFGLNKINEIKDYFITEIKEKELTSKIYCLFLLFQYISSCPICSEW